MSHSNLSDEINANLLRLELNGGLDFDALPAGSIVEVQTKNTLYTIRKEVARTLIKGHSKYCPEWVECHIAGSTWGGSMLKIGFIGNGMHLEFTFNGKTITTSPIRSVKVIK